MSNKRDWGGILLAIPIYIFLFASALTMVGVALHILKHVFCER